MGRAVCPPLTPIPVSGPFDRVGVDVLRFPKSVEGNQYVVVFMDYLTKWPEVFATQDQSALTIAKLFVQEVVCRHGVPSQLLSDRGKAFLSQLMMEVCRVLGVKKVNTTAYHPQTDGLVERFNRTLINMLAKRVERHGQDWDHHLLFTLFAYRASLQESTQESPFLLLYGRDPRLPSSLDLEVELPRERIDLDGYKEEMMESLSEAWVLARKNIEKSQKAQKKSYDRKAKEPAFKQGERVFVYMPKEKASNAYKFARPFYGPYRVVEILETGLVVRPVDRPEGETMRVACNRVRRCLVPGKEFWPPRRTARDQKRPAMETLRDTPKEIPGETPSVWRGRLRGATATKSVRDDLQKN